jgi:serine/threonine-protein kinase HipA
MNIYEVDAYIYDKKIGTLLLKDETVYFEYDKEFKKYNLEISPLKLPLTLNGIYTNRDDRYFEQLPGVFYDSLPDKFGTKIIQRYFESKGISSYNLNVIQKLMFIGDKSIGAITYKPSLNISNTAQNQLIELNEFYNSAKRVIEGRSIDVVDEMLHFMDSAASAGGARAKAVIAYNETTKEMISGLSDTLPKDFHHYLIKFDIQKDNGNSSDFTKLEYIYMSMAKEVGINIPKIKLLKHGNLYHYLIKRFDRVDNKRVHLHSVAGITHSNFNLPMHYSYDELFRLTRYLTGNQQDVIEQYRRMVFNIIGRNQDDHAKNFSFIMNEDGVWNISPAYDITYANGAGYTKNHQLSLMGKVNDFTKQDLLEIAKIHSIKNKDAQNIIDKTLDIFKSFEDRAKEYGIDSKLIEEISKNIRIL